MWSLNDVNWKWQTFFITCAAYDCTWKECIWYLDSCFHNEWIIDEEKINTLIQNFKDKFNEIIWTWNICITDFYVIDGYKIFGSSEREH